MSRISAMLVVGLAAMGTVASGSTAASAQTKPAVTSLGPDSPTATVAWEAVQEYYQK